jgi:predicted Ser/Thr protein kinase
MLLARVSFWFKKKKDETTEATAPPPAERDAPPERAELALLRSLASAFPPTTDAAVAALRALRASPDEARAVDLLVHLDAERPLADPLAVAAAAALVDRGEPAAALGLLTRASSSPALLMAADLRAERGQFAEALSLVERVLLRDLDHPGARERHRRMRTALGLESEPVRADAAAATVVTREPDAPFVLLREVARGGAGAVYEAEDRDLGRRVALKVYHRAERDRAQLAHEARVAAELAGPGIIRVFDIDPDHGWIALEWAPLGSLRDHVRARDRDLLAPLERWALPLAIALARVHAAGWVHHDVKPANVLLHAPDRPLLADFGIARRKGEPSRIQQDGGVVSGSLSYVSPERLAGRASDPRDDIYGFGRILEDVMGALEGTPESAPLSSRWRPIALACLGPDASRPSDARALVTRIRVESA